MTGRTNKKIAITFKKDEEALAEEIAKGTEGFSFAFLKELWVPINNLQRSELNPFQIPLFPASSSSREVASSVFWRQRVGGLRASRCSPDRPDRKTSGPDFDGHLHRGYANFWLATKPHHSPGSHHSSCARWDACRGSCSAGSSWFPDASSTRTELLNYSYVLQLHVDIICLVGEICQMQSLFEG